MKAPEASLSLVPVNAEPPTTDKVPVVLLDGVEHAYWTIREDVLRRALRG